MNLRATLPHKWLKWCSLQQTRQLCLEHVKDTTRGSFGGRTLKQLNSKNLYVIECCWRTVTVPPVAQSCQNERRTKGSGLNGGKHTRGHAYCTARRIYSTNSTKWTGNPAKGWVSLHLVCSHFFLIHSFIQPIHSKGNLSWAAFCFTIFLKIGSITREE